MSIEDYRAKVIRVIQDTPGSDGEGVLHSDHIDAFIEEALPTYSKDRPKENINDTTGDGTQLYSVPSDWVAGFSSILSLEFPTGNVPQTILTAEDDYFIYQETTTTFKIQFVNNTPNASETFRLKYTVPYTVDIIENIPAQDQDAFVKLCAVQALKALARKFTGTQDPTIDADSVNYRTKGDEFARRAKDLQGEYDAFVLDAGAQVSAAGVTKNWDTEYSWGGDFLTHPKRFR